MHMNDMNAGALRGGHWNKTKCPNHTKDVQII